MPKIPKFETILADPTTYAAGWMINDKLIDDVQHIVRRHECDGGIDFKSLVDELCRNHKEIDLQPTTAQDIVAIAHKYLPLDMSIKRGKIVLKNCYEYLLEFRRGKEFNDGERMDAMIHLMNTAFGHLTGPSPFDSFSWRLAKQASKAYRILDGLPEHDVSLLHDDPVNTPILLQYKHGKMRCSELIRFDPKNGKLVAQAEDIVNNIGKTLVGRSPTWRYNPGV